MNDSDVRAKQNSSVERLRTILTSFDGLDVDSFMSVESFEMLKNFSTNWTWKNFSLWGVRSDKMIPEWLLGLEDSITEITDENFVGRKFTKRRMWKKLVLAQLVFAFLLLTAESTNRFVSMLELSLIHWVVWSLCRIFWNKLRCIITFVITIRLVYSLKKLISFETLEFEMLNFF